MKYLMLFFTLIPASFVYADQVSYRIDDERLNEMFNSASETEVVNFTDFQHLHFANGTVSVIHEKDAWVAFALSMVFYVTGISGLQRLYLGTDAGVFIAYLLTGGGCGIIQFVDTVVLFLGAMEDDISKYVDNRKLFMW